MRQALAAAAVAALVLTGCGGSEEAGEADAPAATPAEGTTSASPGESPTDAGTGDDDADDDGDDDRDDAAVEIEIEGDRVEPNGARVQATVGEPLRLEVEADRAGELHVHSSPEQVLEFRRGEQVLELVIERPGVVEVEEHESGMVILQVEVR